MRWIWCSIPLAYSLSIFENNKFSALTGLDSPISSSNDASAQKQMVFESRAERIEETKKGFFLSLTDLHPDPFYTYGTPVNKACHDLNTTQSFVTPTGFWKESDSRSAGYWGTKSSMCDAPLTLINATFDWLSTHFSDQVDFIVWTGDSVRHDLDENLPRSLEEIYKFNRFLTNRLEESFPATPIVGTLGNNDVSPHNFMEPNTVLTAEFSEIWKDMIPERYHDTFVEGAYFATPVGRDSVIISLNTLFFFNLNTGVKGCNSAADPGSIQLVWLEKELNEARRKDQQVWVIGHVPPGDWFKGCFEIFGEIILSYQDTILGGIYGHTNLDSFFFISAQEIPSLRHSSQSNSLPEPTVLEPMNWLERFQEALLATFKNLPTKKKINLDDYSIINMQPSVIPTYQPTIRVWQYNLDGKRYEKDKNSHKQSRHASPRSPSRKNSYLTPLGYVQYYLDLDKANLHSGYGPGGANLLQELGEAGERPLPQYEIEYTTFDREALATSLLGFSSQPSPIPFDLLPLKIQKIIASFSIDQSTPRKRKVKELGKALQKAGLVSYGMKDLTIGSWIKFARELGEGKESWKGFLRNMFVRTG